jgi:hypothetical protein
MSEACSTIHQIFGGMRRFYFPFNADEIPSDGVYVLFERGEKAHGGDRIVRIGTHNGDNQLRSRLFQHFLKENKDRSIFRKNIGRALLNRDKDSFLEQWELDLTERKAKEIAGEIDFMKQREVERKVTEHIQKNFSFIALGIKDKAKRLEFESKIISTVSLCDGCRPSQDWLGLFSPKDKIRESGLWQVNELNKTPLNENEISDLQKIANTENKK